MCGPHSDDTPSESEFRERSPSEPEPGAELSTSLPAPVLFNSFKHHAREIHRRVCHLVAQGVRGRQELLASMRHIGARVTDLYVGRLMPEAIAAQLVEHLQQTGLLQPEVYRGWIEQHSGYAMAEVADGSRWCLRWGTLESRHVHIHPGRYSPLTLRVRASQLKTAIATIALAESEQRNPLSLNVVNDARRELLQLGPVQALPSRDGLGVVLRAMLDAPT